MHYFSGGLSTDKATCHHTIIHTAASCHDEEEPFEPTAEIEAQTIGNLLPDEDDLFSDVFNELEFCSDVKGDENAEDFDLFSSVGGMELEGDNVSSVGNRGSDFSRYREKSKGLLASTNKLGPSWTGGSNQCLTRKCRELEKDGAGLSKSTDGILSSQFDGLRNGSLKGLHSANQNLLSDRSSFMLNSFPSSLSMSSTGDHFGLPMHSHSLNPVEFGGRYISSSEPHSFPDCENNLNYFTPYVSGSNGANMAGSVASDMNNIMHINGAGLNRQPMESQGRIIGPFGNATCPVHGRPWSNCYLFHQNSLGHNIFPNSPLFANVINSRSPPQKTGFSAYFSGSLENMGPFSRFPSPPIARGSPILSHSYQNCKIDSNYVMNSSPQAAHSLGSPPEVWRNLSRRRNQSYSHANKKEFELDIERILRGDDGRTTLMLKNIPNKYSSKLLVAAIDEHCKGMYDFVYLPIDFKNNCNVGYAFINLIDPLQIVPFYKSFSGKKWEKFNSEKVAALAYARIQGKAALITHFQNSSLMNEDKGCRPVLFCTDGPNAGKQEPFPLGTNIRGKSSKARGSVYEENRHYHGSPSTSPNSSDSDRASVSPNSVIGLSA